MTPELVAHLLEASDTQLNESMKPLCGSRGSMGALRLMKSDELR